MTRREQLAANYENALFAILMDEVAEEEGKKLLEKNERLKQNPNAAVPKEIDARCLKTIKQAFAKNRRQTIGTTAYRVFNKLAMEALISVLLFTGAYAAFPEVRVRTINLLIEVSDVATNLSLGDGNINSNGSQVVSDGELLNGYHIPTVPEGFTQSFSDSNSWSADVIFDHDNGARIIFGVTSGTGGSLNVDTEDAQSVESIQIHGHDGLLIEKGDRVHIVWVDTVQGRFIEVICINLDKSIALELANEIVFAGEK